MNLLKETLEDIKASGHEPGDIVFIGSRESGHECSWDEFVNLADRDYDSGFGAQEVASDLEIVFSDGSGMWRHEYDGSERWEYSRPFERPEQTHKITSLFVPASRVGWVKLEEIHDEDGA